MQPNHTIKALIFVTPSSNSVAVSRRIGTKLHTHMQGSGIYLLDFQWITAKL